MRIPLYYDVDDRQAFFMLCDTLHIKDLVLSEDNLVIRNGKVCKEKDGKYTIVDDRADLFAALRNVANANWPNLEFRSDPYITHYGDNAISVRKIWGDES